MMNVVNYAKIKKIDTELANIMQHVKAIKVLTQAEYDALGSSKDTDNVLYLIKG